MKALKRSLAAWLALSLACAPAVQAANFGEAASQPLTPIILPQAPLVSLAVPALQVPSAALTATTFAQPLALPAAAVLPTPAALSIPQASNAAAPGAKDSRPATAALPQLQAASDAKTPELGSLAFDGGLLRAASAGDVGDTPGQTTGPKLSPAGNGAATPTPEPPAPPRKSWLKRLNESTKSSKTEVWLERGLILGAAVALAAPVLWKAAPIHTLMMTTPAALVIPALIGVGVALYRVGRFILGRAPSAPRAPPARKTLVRSAVLGLALGLALGVAPTVGRSYLVQAVQNHTAPAEQTVRVPGGAIGQTVIADFSQNPVGRRVLDGLRDRSGTVRLPVFMVRKETDAIASHVAIFDAVFIGEAEVKGFGWTVADFLKDPAKQAKYVHDNQALFAHELTHAVQSRRSPLEPGQFGMPIESEYEAYVNQHLYTHEQLKVNPSVNVGSEIGSYEVMLDDVFGYLKGLDTDSAYKNDTHVDSPRNRAWTAALRRDWPAHQIEGYSILARRHAKIPFLVKSYQKKAAAIAAANGLTLPPELRAPQVK